MQFHERNPAVIGAVVAVLIIGGTIAALGLQGGTFRGGYSITAEFADAAGVRVGDQVIIAGIRTGNVTAVRLARDRVEVDMTVEGAEVPSTARANIVLRTLVGRRSVELVAEGDFSDLLEDGDRIPLERTGVPTDVPEFADVSERLLAEVDSEALDEFLATITDVTREQRVQVEALIQGGNRLTGVVNDQEEELRELLRQLRRTSETLASRDAELVRIVDDFGTVVATLAERREDVRALIRETNASSAVAADLVADQRDELDTILTEVHGTTAVLSRHQLDLAEALAYIGDAIHGFSSIAYRFEEPVPWGHVFTTSLGPAGIDALAGCGGLIDRQLDEILGPDPRSCEEQDVDSFPEDVDEPEGAGPPLPGLSAVEGPAGVDALARRALQLRDTPPATSEPSMPEVGG